MSKVQPWNYCHHESKVYSEFNYLIASTQGEQRPIGWISEQILFINPHWNSSLSSIIYPSSTLTNHLYHSKIWDQVKSNLYLWESVQIHLQFEIPLIFLLSTHQQIFLKINERGSSYFIIMQVNFSIGYIWLLLYFLLSCFVNKSNLERFLHRPLLKFLFLCGNSDSVTLYY